eukprot:353600-Chlamydomonas_euryale.AAC.2
MSLQYAHGGTHRCQVRKLEFLLAEAKERGCDCVVTIGGIQSNHCRATAVAARYGKRRRCMPCRPVFTHLTLFPEHPIVFCNAQK